MRKITYVIIILGLIGAVGTTLVNIYLGKEFAWPAIAAIWIAGSFFQQKNIDRLEDKGHGIKS